jgi:hypothetical protein
MSRRIKIRRYQMNVPSRWLYEILGNMNMNNLAITRPKGRVTKENQTFFAKTLPPEKFVHPKQRFMSF